MRVETKIQLMLIEEKVVSYLNKIIITGEFKALVRHKNKSL